MVIKNKANLSGMFLARNSIINFIGLLIPMLVALVIIPILIAGFGKERFGLLVIIWMGVGYFSFFDMGFGRALTKIIAERLGTGNIENISELIWTALFLIFLFGVAGALILGLGAGELIVNVLNVDTGLQVDGVTSFRVLAISLPVVVLSSALIGILEAHQKFGTIVAIRIPLGILNYLSPLIALQFSSSLVLSTIVLVVIRILFFFIYYYFVVLICPELRTPKGIQKEHMRSLLKFGSWITVTNLISPLMVNVDRLFIGSILSMTAVTYYVTPFEILSRIQVLPISMMAVLFPALTIAIQSDNDKLVYIFSHSSKVTMLLVLPMTGVFFLLAPELLTVWLGKEFSVESKPVVQWLSVGWAINSLARVPFVTLQSAGRPDLVAKAHMLELVPYVLLVWSLTKNYGISGTAAAWFLRVFLDTIILNWLVTLTLPQLSTIVVSTIKWIFLLTLSFYSVSLINEFPFRLLLVVILISFVLFKLFPIFWPLFIHHLFRSKIN